MLKACEIDGTKIDLSSSSACTTFLRKTKRLKPRKRVDNRDFYGTLCIKFVRYSNEGRNLVMRNELS